MTWAGNPSDLVIEVNFTGSTWTTITDSGSNNGGYVDRDSVRREAPAAGKPGRFTFNLTLNGIDFTFKPWMKVRASKSGAWYFGGVISDIQDSSIADNEKTYIIQVDDYSVYLDRGSHQLPAGYVTTAGQSDSTIITAFMGTYCPEIGTTMVHTVITECPSADLSYMSKRQALDKLKEFASSSQSPDYMVLLDVSGNPQLAWFDWNNSSHTPTLNIQISDQQTEDSTHKHAMQITREIQGQRVITKQTVVGADGAEGTIDGSIAGPYTFTSDYTTDTLTSTGHGLTNGEEIYLETTGTLPSPLSDINTGTSYFARNVTANTFQVAQRSANLAGMTFTATTADDRLWITNHGFENGLAFTVSSTGSLPSPLVAGTVYYTRDVTTNSMKVCATVGGAVIDLTTTGSGTMTLVAGVVIDLTSNGTGTHKAYDVRFDEIAHEAYQYYNQTICAPVVTDNTLLTDNDCRVLARAYCHAHSSARTTLKVRTRWDLDPYEYAGPHKVAVTDALMGLNGALDNPWPMVNSTLDFTVDGVATWDYELGDSFVELRDSDLSPQFGGQRFGQDLTPPSVPSGLATLENVLISDLGYVRLRVGWTSNPEADMFDYIPRVLDATAERWFYPPTIKQTGSPTLDLTYLHIPPGHRLLISLRARDRHGNMSDWCTPLDLIAATGEHYRTLNYSFEELDTYDPTMAAHWSRLVTNGGVVAVTTAAYYGGRQSMKIDATAFVGGTQAWVLSEYQYVPANARMRVQGVFKSHGSLITGAFQAYVYWYQWNGSGYTFLSSTPVFGSTQAVPATWTKFSGWVTAPSNANAAVLYGGSPNGSLSDYYYLDDFLMDAQVGADGIENQAIQPKHLLMKLDSTDSANGMIWIYDPSGNQRGDIDYSVGGTNIRITGYNYDGSHPVGIFIANTAGDQLILNPAGGITWAQTANSIIGGTGVLSLQPSTHTFINGAMAWKVAGVGTVITAISPDATAVVWPYDASGGAINLTLPSAASAGNRMYVVKKVDSSANKINLNRSGSDTIDGGTVYSINTQWSTVILVSDGSSKWYVIAKF